MADDKAEETERRSESRRNVNLQVEYPDRQGYPIDVTESVSPSGLLIRSSSHHRVGEEVRLAVSLPGFPDSLPLTGVVARIRQGTPDTPRAVALHIPYEEYQRRLSEVLSPSVRRDFSLSSGPYAALAALPRIRLASTPTPLHRAERLSKHLGGPDIWFKRDDLTGFALGGNKVRKMELMAANALEQGADTLVTAAASPRSAKVRVMAAAAARLGLRSVALVQQGVVGGGDESEAQSFSEILNTELRKAPATTSQMEKALAACIEGLRNEGRNPYCISGPDVGWLGAAGYLLATIEIIVQLRRLQVQPQALICPVSSGETMAGLLVGQRWLDTSYDVHGVSVLHDERWCIDRITSMAAEICSELKIADTIPVADVLVSDDLVSENHLVACPASRDAVKLVAQWEGIFLDPVFSGRAMAGLLRLIERGELRKGQSVLFLHTGGWH